MSIIWGDGNYRIIQESEKERNLRKSGFVAQIAKNPASIIYYAAYSPLEDVQDK